MGTVHRKSIAHMYVMSSGMTSPHRKYTPRSRIASDVCSRKGCPLFIERTTDVYTAHTHTHTNFIDTAYSWRTAHDARSQKFVNLHGQTKTESADIENMLAWCMWIYANMYAGFGSVLRGVIRERMRPTELESIWTTYTNNERERDWESVGRTCLWCSGSDVIRKRRDALSRNWTIVLMLKKSVSNNSNFYHRHRCLEKIVFH